MSSLIALLNSTQIQWYHNGTAVDVLRTNSSWKTQGERLNLSLTVFNASEEMDLGLYEGIVNVEVRDFYVSTGRPSDYDNYVRTFIYPLLQIFYFSFVILRYGKLEILSCTK